MLIIDVLIVIVIVSLFYFLNLTGILPIAACIAVALLLHFGLAGVLQVKQKKDKEEKLIADQKNRINKKIQELRSRIESSESDVPDEILELVKDFIKALSYFENKKKVLFEISSDKSLKRDLDASEDYLIGLSERLEVKLKILKVIDRNDYHFDTISDDVEEIVSTANELVNKMDDLLVEVSRSDDYYDSEEQKRESINESIERLRQVREQNKALLVEDPDEGFLLKSSGSNIGI